MQYTFLMSAFICFENKGNVQEKNTVKPLLADLAYQPPFSFAVWKTTLSHEANDIKCLAKLDMTNEWYFRFYYVNMNQNLLSLFFYLR